MSPFCLMKSLTSIKLYQTRFFSSFLIFRKKKKKIVFDDQLKCIKLFIKLAGLMEFDEQFEAFAPACSVPVKHILPALRRLHFYKLQILEEGEYNV